MAPKIFSSPDVLRFRIFEVDNAMTLQGASYETKDKDLLHSYFTLIELDTEEWPWSIVLELDEHPKWKQYFEGQDVVVSYQLSFEAESPNRVIEVATQHISGEKKLPRK